MHTLEETLEIRHSFAQIVADSLMIDGSQVTEESTLEELGAESLDVVEISMETESKFNVWLPEKNILETAIAIAGRPMMLDGQVLTGLGKRMFRARLPREQWSLLDGDVTAAELGKYFMRIDTWVGMIAELREYTPKACPACGGSALSDKPGFMLLCEACGHETKLRAGEDINREWVERFMAENSVPAVVPCPVATPADAESAAS